MLSGRVTCAICKLFKEGSKLLKFKSCNCHTTSVMQQKKGKKKKGWFSKKAEDDTFKIVKPGNCTDVSAPILDPLCKVAIVVGGANGFGFAAAEHLLCKGARGVLIGDVDPEQGILAAKKLCDSYGKHRACFFECDIRNVCQFEASLKQMLSKHKQIHILFNDLDKQRSVLSCNCEKAEQNWNNTTRAIRLGMKILGKQNGGPGGIIVNCASVFGFLGWPHDPFPIYCMKEPVIESTMDLAKEYKEIETGVRLIAMCPTNKPFSEIGLPDFPDPTPNNRITEMPLCIPSSTWRIGSALSYVLATAKNGSTWIVEPATSPREIPQLVHFPKTENEKVDPKVYDKPPCAVALEPHCAAGSKTCSADKGKICDTKASKKR